MALILTQFILLALPGHSVHAAQIAGVRVALEARVGGVELKLNGAGLRRRFGADIYVIGVYLPERTTSAESAVNGAGPKRIALSFMRDVSAQSHRRLV